MDKANAWSFAASAAWPVAILLFALWFKTEINSLVRSVVIRLRSGAGLKVGAFELPPLIFTRAGAITYDVEDDEAGAWGKKRQDIYEASRHIFLVHKLYKSTDDSQLFDIEVLVTTHKSGSLQQVVEVRYFFGKHWGRKIFVSRTRHNGFAIRISAYGSALSLAEVKFTDGQTISLNRYLDFEMGAQAPLIEPQNDRGEKT